MTRTVGLRTEVLITLSLLLGAALLFGGLVMLRLVEKNIVEERISSLEALSYHYANYLRFNPLPSDRNAMSAMLNYGEGYFHINDWWLYDQTLSLVVSMRDSNFSPFSSATRQQSRFSKEIIRSIDLPNLLNIYENRTYKANYFIPLHHNSEFVGLFEVSYSLQDIQHRLLIYLKSVLIYTLLYLFILLVAGYYLFQRNIISPARNLLMATESVAQGHLTTRLPVRGPFEIERLSESYNQMVEALEKSRSETQQQIANLQESNHQLQEKENELFRNRKMALIGHLAAGLAHELGNPLSAIIGYLELLKQRVDDSEAKDILKRSLAETDRIDFLVRELSDLSRPDKRLHSETLNLFKELESGMELLNNQGQFRNIEIVNSLPELVGFVDMNRNKLQQVFVNLLLNAVDACEEAGRIILSGGIDRSMVWVSVADNGVGIATENLANIFDPFFSTKDPGRGTGLGLAICQRIIEEAHGEIKVESVCGEGSVFFVSLPAVESK